MIFGDLFVVWMMEKNKFTLDEYALNHPAGFIGKKLNLTVNDVMMPQTELPLVNQNAPFSEILDKLTEKLLGCVLIIGENEKLLGIYTDGDLKRTLKKDAKFLQKKAIDVMIKNPKTIASNTLAHNALKQMQKITVMPVIEDDRLIGLVRLQEIIANGISL